MPPSSMLVTAIGRVSIKVTGAINEGYKFFIFCLINNNENIDIITDETNMVTSIFRNLKSTILLTNKKI